MKSRLIGWVAGLMVALVPAVPRTSYAENQQVDGVMAGFVYNFTKFVDWPLGTLRPGGDLELCVAGRALNGRLDDLNGRQSQGRDIRVRSIGAATEVTGCHVLFIGATESRRLAGLVNGVEGSPVLTISDMADFTASGGMIGLFVQNDRVKFAINLSATRAAGLKPSAQLLRLGRVEP